MPTPAHTEQLGALTMRTLSVSEMDNIVYLLDAGDQLLVDAADDAAAILALASPARLRTVVTTHRHWDHHRALPEVVTATGAETAAGEADADHLPVEIDRRLRHGDRLAVDGAGTVVLDVIALRGHTPGSVALAYTEDSTGPRPGRVHLFVGDSLFPGGVGKTVGPEQFTSLLDDVEQRLFAIYPDDTVVWPGHGLPTTLGAERPHLPEWRRRGW